MGCRHLPDCGPTVDQALIESGLSIDQDVTQALIKSINQHSTSWLLCT